MAFYRNLFKLRRMGLMVHQKGIQNLEKNDFRLDKDLEKEVVNLIFNRKKINKHSVIYLFLLIAYSYYFFLD